MKKIKVNILITSASKKVWLVQAFKDALKQLRNKGKVISADFNLLSATFYLSDKHYLVPLSTRKDFIPTILNICKKENVKLIIPTRDTELLLFAQKKENFAKLGIKIMVSTPNVIKACNDKYEFYKFLTKNKISAPVTYLPNKITGSMHYPLVIKSRYGSGAQAVFKAKNTKELNFFKQYISNPIIQEFVRGKEYTIDVFSDFDANVISIIPRERIEVVAGESYKGKTIKNKRIIEYARKLTENLGSIGHITIQCIKDKKTIKFIEVNPRFGGGALLGIMSGANTPLMLIKILLGKKVTQCIGKFKKDLIMLRYTKDLFIHGNKQIN